MAKLYLYGLTHDALKVFLLIYLISPFSSRTSNQKGGRDFPVIFVYNFLNFSLSSFIYDEALNWIG